MDAASGHHANSAPARTGKDSALRKVRRGAFTTTGLARKHTLAAKIRMAFPFVSSGANADRALTASITATGICLAGKNINGSRVAGATSDTKKPLQAR